MNNEITLSGFQIVFLLLGTILLIFGLINFLKGRVWVFSANAPKLGNKWVLRKNNAFNFWFYSSLLLIITILFFLIGTGILIPNTDKDCALTSHSGSITCSPLFKIKI